jgi:hypothetical protein
MVVWELVYDMFRPTGPSSGNTHYVENTWEGIVSIKHYKKKWDIILLEIVVID